jgi:hypothetical protein
MRKKLFQLLRQPPGPGLTNEKIFLKKICHQQMNPTKGRAFTVHFDQCVRLPLQSATPPHWANSPMAVRAIPASARRRTARRLPNRIQIMFWRAATFIQLLAWVDIKMLKRLKPENRKKSIKITCILFTYSYNTTSIFWHELAYTLHLHFQLNLTETYAALPLTFPLDLTCVTLSELYLGTVPLISLCSTCQREKV